MQITARINIGSIDSGIGKPVPAGTSFRTDEKFASRLLQMRYAEVSEEEKPKEIEGVAEKPAIANAKASSVREFKNHKSRN